MLASDPVTADAIAKAMGARAFQLTGSARNLEADFSTSGGAHGIAMGRVEQASEQLARVASVKRQYWSASGRLCNAGLRPATSYGTVARAWPPGRLADWRREIGALHFGKGAGRSLSGAS